MNRELDELFQAADKIRNRVGSAVELPREPGEYALVGECDYRSRLTAEMTHQGYWPRWRLDGVPISAESLRMYLETHRLELQVIEE